MEAVKKILKRYFVDALGAMALGLFSSLIIGLIISLLAYAIVNFVIAAITGQNLDIK